jgi:hydroxyacylglutathione hydrolase
MFLRQISDPALGQNAYLIGCQRTGEALLVDPQRDVDRYLRIAAENGLRIVAVAETHIHADYLSGARELVTRHGALAYLSAEGGPAWQFEWAKDEPNARFLHDRDAFQIGNVGFQAYLTPGHTPEHLSFLVSDFGGQADEPIALLSGDFIFVGDVGRPDLLESAAGQMGTMEASARALFASLRASSWLPDHLQVLPGHGADQRAWLRAQVQPAVARGAHGQRGILRDPHPHRATGATAVLRPDEARQPAWPATAAQRIAAGPRKDFARLTGGEPGGS